MKKTFLSRIVALFVGGGHKRTAAEKRAISLGRRAQIERDEQQQRRYEAAKKRKTRALRRAAQKRVMSKLTYEERLARTEKARLASLIARGYAPVTNNGAVNQTVAVN